MEVLLAVGWIGFEKFLSRSTGRRLFFILLSKRKQSFGGKRSPDSFHKYLVRNEWGDYKVLGRRIKRLCDVQFLVSSIIGGFTGSWKNLFFLLDFWNPFL